MGAIRSAGTQYRFEWGTTEPFDVDQISPIKLRTAIVRLSAPVRDLFFGVAMIPYAQLRFGRGFVPGHAAAYFVQRCVTHPTVRRCVASVLAAGVRSRHATLATRREPDLQDALGGLERDGIAMLPNLFSTSELADVVGFFLSQPVAAPGGGCVARDGLPAGATMAAYHLATVVACPWLMTAINRADILRLASAFLGCKPTLCSVGVRWSFPDSKSPDATQAFHRDPDDWRFLKLFVYLTDVVDGESGPHIFVAGSHNTRQTLARKDLCARAARGSLWKAEYACHPRRAWYHIHCRYEWHPRGNTAPTGAASTAAGAIFHLAQFCLALQARSRSESP